MKKNLVQDINHSRKQEEASSPKNPKNKTHIFPPLLLFIHDIVSLTSTFSSCVHPASHLQSSFTKEKICQVQEGVDHRHQRKDIELEPGRRCENERMQDGWTRQKHFVVRCVFTSVVSAAVARSAALIGLNGARHVCRGRWDRGRVRLKLVEDRERF